MKNSQVTSFELGDTVEIVSSFTIGYDENTLEPIMASTATVTEILMGGTANEPYIWGYSVHPQGYHNPFVDFRPWELAPATAFIKMRCPRQYPKGN